jgi:hypothetical protein
MMSIIVDFSVANVMIFGPKVDLGAFESSQGTI